MTSALVVELMKDGNEAVCSAGAEALWRHSYEGRAEGVMEAGGVHALLAAMAAHILSEDVCRNVSYAFYILMAESSERRAAIDRAGAAPLLAAACRNRRGYDWAHRALERLGYTDDGDKIDDKLKVTSYFTKIRGPIRAFFKYR